jgi:hypothetical protein
VDSAGHRRASGPSSALTERRPAVVIVQESEYSDPPRQHGSVYSSVGWSMPHTSPDDKLLRQAADIVNEGQKVAILIGQGARKASAEVGEVAELLGAGVAKALLGKEAIPDTLPYTTGPLGLLGTEPSNKMMEGCDTLFMIGTSFPYAEWLPKPGQARCVEIDIDGSLIGVRYPNDVSLVGDSQDTLRALIPLLERKTDRKWRAAIEGEVRTWRKVLEDRARQPGNPLNPQYVFYELNKRLPDRCITTSDSGSATNWWARYIDIRPGQAGVAVGHAGHHGPRRAVRHRGQVWVLRLSVHGSAWGMHACRQPSAGSGTAGCSVACRTPPWARTRDAGIVTVTDSPPLSRGRAVTVPPWTSEMDATIVRPSPNPSCDVRLLRRWNGWNIHSTSDVLTTGPVFTTDSSLAPATVRVLIQMSPVGTL